jgi:hypothetical protein
VTITGCTFYGNTADHGGAIYNYDSSATVSNCILWADSAPDGPEIYGDCTVSYSDVEGGFAGAGNIDADPCFADAGGDDFHLLDGSPCIDTGDPAYSPAPDETDIDRQPRQMGLNVDMGADEFSIDKPIFVIWPSQFDFTAGLGGPNPVSQILSIRNIGANTLNWQVTEACSWLEVAPANGQSIGDVNEVTVSVDVTGLSAGPYYCQLTVSDPCATNSPQTVNVSLTVQGPVIGLSGQQLDFYAEEGGSNPTPQIFSISNNGAGTLNWQITEDCNWLWVTPTTGQCTTEPNQVPVIVEIDCLTAGQYNCELVVSDPCAANSPQTVDVYLTISSLTDGLVSWWQFDEGEGATAYDSVGTNHGTIYGATWTTGQINSALDFDGVDDYVGVSDDDSLDFGGNQDFTIEFWFRAPATISSGTLEHFIGHNDGSSGYYVGFYSGDNGEISLGTHHGRVKTTRSQWTGQQWYHIVAANYGSGVDQMYVDGVLDGMGENNYAGPPDAGEPLTIARRSTLSSTNCSMCVFTTGPCPLERFKHSMGKEDPASDFLQWSLYSWLLMEVQIRPSRYLASATMELGH